MKTLHQLSMYTGHIPYNLDWKILPRPELHSMSAYWVLKPKYDDCSGPGTQRSSEELCDTEPRKDEKGKEKASDSTCEAKRSAETRNSELENLREKVPAY